MARPPHNNSFDLVRFILAALVLFSHHYGLSGFAAPKVPLIDISWGRFAVFAFFAVSGFLMYNSLQRSSDFYFYFTSRLLRIVPNLIVAVVATSFILMIIFSNYDNVLSHLYYIRKDALSFIAKPSYWITGIFEDRPDRGINGSLWTLQYEFFMYIVIFLIFLLPRKIVGYALILTVVISSLPFLQSIDDTKRIATFHVNVGDLWKTGFHFLVGALIAHFWTKISTSRVVYITIAIVTFTALAIFAPDKQGWMLALIWVPFFVLSMSPFASWFGKLGDASYGVYIYAFPIQQVSILAIPSFWGSMAASLILTVAIGFACWHGFEKRCLAKRRTVSERWRASASSALGATKGKASKFLDGIRSS